MQEAEDTEEMAYISQPYRRSTGSEIAKQICSIRCEPLGAIRENLGDYSNGQFLKYLKCYLLTGMSFSLNSNMV